MGRPKTRDVVRDELRDAIREVMPLVPHVYGAEDFPDGMVLPQKPYTLPIPDEAKSAVAAHVSVISGEAMCYLHPRYAIIRNGDLWVEMAGSGVAAGISVLFRLPT